MTFDKSLTVGRINCNIDDRQLYIYMYLYIAKIMQSVDKLACVKQL